LGEGKGNEARDKEFGGEYKKKKVEKIVKRLSLVHSLKSLTRQ